LALGIELLPVPRAKTSPSEETPPRLHSGELSGLILLGLSVVLALALFSYDRGDLARNASPPNEPIHNLLGRLGASVADLLLFGLGASAYLLPVLLLAFGVAGFVPGLAYLRRGWKAPLAALGLLIACAGMLDLFTATLPSLGTRGNTLGAGGLIGSQMNSAIVVYFLNRTGAVLCYGFIYLASLVLLTDFLIVAAVRKLLTREPKNEEERLAFEQKALEKEAKRLAKEAKMLESQAAAETGRKRPAPDAVAGEAAPDEPRVDLGPDLRPVPEPRFQDNSVSKLRGGDEIVTDGTTISAAEIAGAAPATDAVLGRKSALKTIPPPEVPPPVDEPAPAAAEDPAPPPAEDDDATLPEPVLPAMSTCGMSARSAMIGWP